MIDYYARPNLNLSPTNNYGQETLLVVKLNSVLSAYWRKIKLSGGVSTFQLFSLRLCFFIVIIFIISTICQPTKGSLAKLNAVYLFTPCYFYLVIMKPTFCYVYFFVLDAINKSMFFVNSA